MFACGDAETPNESTLDLLETYAEEFIINLVMQAQRRSQRHASNSLRVADILHVIRKDDVKYLRMPYIITMDKALQKAQKSVTEGNKYCDDEVRKNLKLA